MRDYKDGEPLYLIYAATLQYKKEVMQYILYLEVGSKNNDILLKVR